MTGLNNTMRANFGLMKDMGQHMFQPPHKKVETIMKFIARIRSPGGPVKFLFAHNSVLRSLGIILVVKLQEFIFFRLSRSFIVGE